MSPLMTDIKAIISKNITELRQKAGMTQLELGEKLNYSDKTISKWERGQTFPDLSRLDELSELLGVAVAYLLTGQE